MSTTSEPLWVAWVAGVRRGELKAREDLVAYFTPFAHAVLVCHLAHHVASEQVNATIDEALKRVSELKEQSGFGELLFDVARRVAVTASRKPGATLELLGASASLTEGRKVLSKIRGLGQPTRERLMLRLLEGITGAEIAEVTGAGQSEVRSDLERGLALLVKELGGATVNATGDSYLWSLTGTPNPAIAPLENQLTPLRYDASGHDGFVTEAVRANPAGPVPEKKTEGRRTTAPDQPHISLRDDDDEPTTTPSGKRLKEEETAAGVAMPDERTKAVTDLPAEARKNPFDAQPGTIPATDLPAEAIERTAIKRAPDASITGNALGSVEVQPTELRPLTAVTVRRQSEKQPAAKDPDTTAPRGRPITVLASSYEAPSTTGSVPSDPGQDWRTSVLDVRPEPAPPPPRPLSFTRGITPFVLSVVMFAFFGAVAYINVRATERNAKRGWNLVRVTVAARNIPEGTIVDYGMVSSREVPEQFVTASVVRPDSTAYVMNQRIMVPVQAGDPLLWSQFETARASERLSRRIHARGRAYTIDSRQVTSVGGWVRPGDHVDIIISVKETKTSEAHAITTLQNVVVLATGKMTVATNMGLLKPDEKEYTHVSVMVLPEEVDLLALMRNRARYQLVLRNDEDFEPFETRAGADTGTLISGERAREIERKRRGIIQQIRKAPKP